MRKIRGDAFEFRLLGKFTPRGKSGTGAEIKGQTLNLRPRPGFSGVATKFPVHLT